ncbi:MAG: hypothetical protein LBR64_01440 [Dysgonamonadaceae bacterium]|jgi:hypothetical protein|nr:hypothetical protein [Dysgonamonadaceae bacterium]
MDENQITELVSRFFEGRTNKAEEREIYEYFAAGAVPDKLRVYRPLFADFAALDSVSGQENELPKQENTEQRQAKKRLWFTSGIAASVAVLLGLGIYFHTASATSENPYEGSYIIRNGKKITDPKIVGPEIEKTLFVVAMDREMSERVAERIEKQELILDINN